MKYFKLFTLITFFLLLIACTKSYIVTFDASDGGSVSNMGGEYDEGMIVSVSAIPDTGYEFLEWSDGSSENPRKIVVSEHLSLTALFGLKELSVSINIEGEGTVSISGDSGQGTFEYGSTATFEAVPADGWEFVSWSGDVESTENLIEIYVNEPKELNVLFSENKDFIYTSNIIDIPIDGYDYRSADQTLYNVSGPFHYNAGGEDYMLYPGVTPLDIDQKSPTIILKRENNIWQFHRKDEEASFYGPRNFEINGNKFAIGDGNERGADAVDWKGDVWYGEILDQGEIKWTKVNGPESEGYYHGTCIGDLNNDGLIDVGGTPIWLPEKRQYRIKTFLQEQDGSFTDKTSYMDDFSDDIPFALDFANVFGDARDEIIAANYGGGDPFTNPNLNNIKIYTYDESNDKYILQYSSNESTAFYNQGLGATSIQSFDFDNDGYLDIAVAREGGTNERGTPGVENWGVNSFEIWRNKGNGEFEAHWSSPVWDEREMSFREFRVFDVNLDGFLDIVLRPFHHGTLYNGTPWPHGKDLIFNHLIWINQGDGTFSYFDGFDFKIEDIENDNVHPYMKDGKLCFIGSISLGESDDSSFRKFKIHHIEVDLKGY